jgi:hypothetical protein
MKRRKLSELLPAMLLASTLCAGAMSTASAQNVVLNPGFESGTNPWTFYTNGAATFSNSAAGASGTNAARIGIATQGSNVQLYQPALALEPATQYTLTFKGYSSTGHDVAVSVLKHVSPYTNYGLSKRVFNLTTTWQTFSVQFTTRNFTGAVSDARLMFAFESYDADGDVYYFDDVTLSRVSTPTETAPTISSDPVNRTVTEGQTAVFSVTATGSTPLSYQWQKDSVAIAGATGSSYTTPPTALTDSGSNFRVTVTNAYGSDTSTAATLTVTTGTPTTGQLLLLDRTFDHTTSYRASVLGETPSPTSANCISVQGIYKSGKTPANVCNHEAFKFFQMPSNNPSNWTSPVDYSTGTLHQRIQVISKPSSTRVKYALCMFQDEIVPPNHACGSLNSMTFTAAGTYYSSQVMTSLYQYSTAVDWDRKPHVIMLHMTDVNNHQPDSYAGYMDLWVGTPNWGLYYPMRLRYTAIVVPPGGGAPVWPE